MKNTFLTLAAVALAAGTAQSAQIFADDFEVYAPANPATDPLDSDVFDPNNVTWTPSSGLATAHRIFDTANYGGTRLWISNTDGTSLTSSGVALQTGMTYTVDFFSAGETTRANRGVDGTFDILVGASLGTATSVLGGPQSYVALGDEDATLNGGGDGIDNDKTEHMHQYAFDAGTVGAGDQMFMVFNRVGINATALGGGAWFAIDDVSIDETATVPEPSSAALVGLGALAGLLRRRR